MLAALIWVSVAMTLVGLAAREAGVARRDLERIREQHDAASLLAGDALDELAAARSRFERSRSYVSNPLVAPFKVLPVLGRQLRSAEALTGAGAEVVAVAIDGGRVMGELTGGEVDAGDRVRVIDGLRSFAGASLDQLDGIDLGPDEALVQPLADARANLDRELEEAVAALQVAELVATGLAEVLAGSRYVVLAANNAEMQAGWGMPLSVGILEVEGGRLELDAMEPAEDLVLPIGAVPAGGDLGRNWGFLRPSQDWRNLAVTANFDEAAAVAAAMWEELGRGPVDGVIALDPFALEAILRITGPVEAEGATVVADELVSLVLHDAYVAQGASADLRDARRERQSEIAIAAVAAATGPETDLLELGRSLAGAAARRHIMAWSSDPEQQDAWAAAGIDGVLGEDSLLVAAVNRGGNKLDWFVDVEAEATWMHGRAGTDVALEITLDNKTPDGEPSYIAGTGLRALAVGEWAGYITVHLPRDAVGGRIDGVDELTVAGGSGATRVVAAPVYVHAGERVTSVVRFTLPLDSAVTVEPSARAHPVRWRFGSESWSDDGRRTVTLR